MEQNRISSSGQHGSHETRTNRAAKGQAGQDGAAATPAQGDGFALLLAALGGAQQDADGLLGAAQDDALAAPAGVADAALPGLQAQDPAMPDAAALAAMMAGAPPGQALAAATAAGDASLAGRLGLGLARPGQDTLVGQTAMLDGAAENAALNGTTVRAAGRARVPAQSWTQALQATTGAQERKGAGHGGVALPAALQGAVTQALAQTQAQAAVGAAAGAPHQAQLQGATPGQGHAGLVQPDLAAVAGPALAAGGAGAAGARAEPAGAQRLDDGQAGGQGVDAAPQGPDAVADAGAADAAAQPGADDLQDQIAERVAYWVHQKSQSAELTLDRDGRAVEVSVALKGDEAHVSFRSDHADARHWLDNSSSQLRELLQREGLQLAGMSVGTTADGGAGGQRGDAGDGARGRQRHAQVQAAAAPGPAGGAARAGQAGERSVDLFV
jgi:flagellar hook-length control protein FliK